MQNRTIISALHALRRDIVRNNLDGLEHVEALLRLRGQDLPRVRKADAAGKLVMRHLIRSALADGPKPRSEIAAYVLAHRPELTAEEAAHRTGQALNKMRVKGWVQSRRRMWVLQ